jgi:hypothetical protein
LVHHTRLTVGLVVLIVISHSIVIVIVISHRIVIVIVISHRNVIVIVISHRNVIVIVISHRNVIVIVISHRNVIVIVISHRNVIVIVISHRNVIVIVISHRNDADAVRLDDKIFAQVTQLDHAVNDRAHSVLAISFNIFEQFGLRPTPSIPDPGKMVRTRKHPKHYNLPRCG